MTKPTDLNAYRRKAQWEAIFKIIMEETQIAWRTIEVKKEDWKAFREEMGIDPVRGEVLREDGNVTEVKFK